MLVGSVVLYCLSIVLYYFVSLHHSVYAYLFFVYVFFPRNAMHKLSLCCCTVCVRPSVTLVYSVEMNKPIFTLFSPLGSHTILVFPYQT